MSNKNKNDGLKVERNYTSDAIKDLVRKNAELKEAIKHFNPCGEWNDDVHDCEFRHYAMEYGSKLTKAKEIIKDLLGSENTSCEEEMFFEIRQKAEQFIKDNEG